MADLPYALDRRRIVMEADPADPREAWGVLNPAAARGRDGELYLFPRLVANGNYSRIGRARVVFTDGEPTGVERLGTALEPEESWERNSRTAGVEDPRIVFLEVLDRYVMAYCAYGPLGPRVAIAVSSDLARWDRLGPATFAYDPGLGVDLNLYSNKDAVFFPEPVRAPGGQPAFALLHRPTWDLSWNAPGEGVVAPAEVGDTRPAIWVSFAPVDAVERDLAALAHFASHRLVALPEQPWESLKIGAGPPPLRAPEGWLVLHHGVAGELVPGRDLQPSVRYCAGALLLDHADVTRVVARSRDPLLEPETESERRGVVPNVVFPTAVDDRGDGSADVYYGMADSRIGVARLLPTS